LRDFFGAVLINLVAVPRNPSFFWNVSSGCNVYSYWLWIKPRVSWEQQTFSFPFRARHRSRSYWCLLWTPVGISWLILSFFWFASSALFAIYAHLLFFSVDCNLNVGATGSFYNIVNSCIEHFNCMIPKRCLCISAGWPNVGALWVF
jgi:hypothetical protein